MNIHRSKLLYYPRLLFKYFLGILYPIIIKIYPLPKVLSIEQTIEKLVNEKLSISRFGDGEFLFIISKVSLPFQKFNDELRIRLIEVLKSDLANHLTGLPIGYYSLTNLNKESRLRWKSNITWLYPRLKKFIDFNKIYANASFTRPYIEYVDKKKSDQYFKKIKQIWYKQNILIIEGEKSRLGVRNDLFSNTNSIERILAPAVNAYDYYSELLEEITKQPLTKLILIALGPTATVLAYDLTKLRYRAIDIGNVDIEYEWFLRGSIKKEKIPGKYTNEASDGTNVENIFDKEYNSQIIARIF